MIYLYDKDETDFTMNGIALLEAKNICMKSAVNGDYELTFSMPPCENWQYVECENIVKVEGQLYRIKIIDGWDVTAFAVYNDAINKHLPNVEDMINKTPRYIMERLFAGTKIHIMTTAEVNALGMEWVTDPTDFFETSRTNPVSALKQLMDTLDKYHVHGELYVDNYNIALVKQIGTDKPHIRIDTAQNAKSVKVRRDTSGLITRLYPYGKDGLEITSVNGGKAYIDSPDTEYSGREGYVNFDEIEDPAELLAAGKTWFAEQNFERKDKVRYAINVEYLDTGRENLHLGDKITVVDREFGVTAEQRVVSMELCPYEKQNSRITVGTPPSTLQQQFQDLVEDNYREHNKHNAQGALKTGWLEMMQGNKSTQINSQLGKQDIALYRTGALFEAPDGSCAVAIIQGQLAIADHKKSNGDWAWTTIMDAGLVIVNEVFTGVLYTSLCNVMSESGKLQIKDSQVTMYDRSGTLRFEAGYNGTRYVFALYDTDGNKAVYMDDAGNLTITGAFATGFENQARTVIDENGIQSWDANGRKAGLWCNEISDGDKRFADLTLYYQGDSIFRLYNANLGSVTLMSQGNSFLSTRGTSSTMEGAWRYKNSEVATQAQIDALQAQINALKGV